MTHRVSLRMATLAITAIVLTACGGGGGDSTATTAGRVQINAERQQILRGGGGGGGGVVVPAPVQVSPLPTVAPAPDVLVYESFGMGADVVRPAGGKGDLRSTFLHTTIGGFWAEYLGSKTNSWITPDGDQTWKFAGIGGYLDPYMLSSPLENDTIGYGAASSEWFDAVTEYPTALLPFSSDKPYAVSIEGWPSVVGGAYLAVGLTSSSVTLSNFSTVGQVWLSLREQQPMVQGPLLYELRLNGNAGPLLASGTIDNVTYNHLVVRYDPVARTVGASVNDVELGTFPVAMSNPRYAGFEGVGIVDTFVIRRLP
jgi:hypothetical protein